MLRRTKIVATLGPSTDDPKVLDRLIEAGVDVVRLNFSHDNREVNRHRAETVRNRAPACGRQVGVLVDLRGRKVRVERFREGKVLLESGSTPLAMSRIGSGLPMFALTRHASTRRKVTLYRGVYPATSGCPRTTSWSPTRRSWMSGCAAAPPERGTS